MANNDIRLNVSANTREAESELKRLEEQFDKLQRVSETTSGNSSPSNSREFEETTKRFQETYTSLVNSMQDGINNLKNVMDEYDRQLEQSKGASDAKVSQSIQSQINALETQRTQFQETLREADELQRKQQQFASSMSSNPNLPSVMPNGNSTFSYGGGYSGGGGGGDNIPPSSTATNNTPGDGGSGNNGLNISNLLGGFFGLMAARRVISMANSGYDLMNRDEASAYRIAQKTGDYGTDFTQARKDMETIGKATGHTMSETAQVASVYETIGGVSNTKQSLADVKTMQEFGRAYAVDDTQLASVAGSMNKIGATNEGDQKRFADMLGQSIKEQNMSGRESELIESTNQLAQSVASSKTTVTNADLTGLMAMQNTFSNMSPQLRGSQGASVLGTMNSNIQNADNGMQILLGRNTEFTGPEGMLALRRQQEKGISDPQNLSKILQNSEKLSGGNKAYQQMILMDKLGISSSVADSLLSEDNYADLKSGKRAQDEIEKLTSSNGDKDSKLQSYMDSGVNRRNKYSANKENSSKALGDIEDSIVTPWQNTYDSVGPVGQVGMNMISTLGGVGAYSLLAKTFRGGLGNIFKGAGSAAEGASTTSKAFSGMFGGATEGFGAGLGKTVSTVGKTLGRFAPGISGVISGVSEYAESKAKGEDTSEAVTKGVGSGVGGGLGAWGGAAAGAAMGGAIGSFVPVLGTAIGAGVGAVAGGIAGALGGSKLGTSIAESGYDIVSGGTDSQETSNSKEVLTSQRTTQQKEWRDILQTESDIVKRREDMNKTSLMYKSNSLDGTSSLWNNANNINSSSPQTAPNEEESFMDRIGNWFSNMLGIDSSSSTGSSSTGSSSTGSSLSGYKTGTGKISNSVLGLKSTVAKYAKQYGIGDQTDLLMAQIMQESGGSATALANDPMQSAEGHGLSAGSLHDQETSIKWGTEEFANRLKDANGDTALALQSYNYGAGFIDYVNKNGGKMTQALVNSFSDQQAKKNGWSSYGDKNYVQHVLQYYNGDNAKKYAIGSKSLSEDGLIYAHKGEKITPADENPDNPTNVSASSNSTSSFLNNLFSANASSKSINVGGSLNLSISVNGTGFSPDNQNKIASAAAEVINNNQAQLMSLLSNGMGREAH